MNRSRAFLAVLALAAASACAPHYADDPFVRAVHQLQPSTVLLTMQVPGETKQSKVDDAFATGMVVASGDWGSDVVTVAHAIEGAWNLRVTIANKQRVKGKIVAKNSDLDVAIVRIPRTHLPIVRLDADAPVEPGRQVGLLGYPIPDQFDEEGLGLSTSLNEGRISAHRPDSLEVTLPIVPGESGSPIFLVDTGQIVGMAESRFDQERSIGFALPAKQIVAFLHRFDSAHGL